ncbi:MAG TPA: hypothetical protein VLI06_14090 [Solimonas sp.]|nr:hypothetical protein [Solimonas sp.]
MRIHPSTRMRALLDIYLALRKPRGGVLGRELLEREWRKTGLRRSDLEQALQELLLRRLLLLAPRDAESYELTYLGERAMHQAPGMHPAALRDWLLLRRARRRQRGLPSPEPGRRHDDDSK